MRWAAWLPKVFWPDFLVKLDWELQSIVECGCKLSSLPGQQCRMTMISTVRQLGPRSGRTANGVPWPDESTSSALQMSRATA